MAVARRTPEQRRYPRRLAHAVLGRRRPHVRHGPATDTRTRRARRSGCRCRPARPRSARPSRGCSSRTTRARSRPPGRVQGIYTQVQRQVYLFLGATLVGDHRSTSAYVIRANRRLFARAGGAVGTAARARPAADRHARSDAARDLARAARRVRPDPDRDGIDARPRRQARAGGLAARAELREVSEIAQTTLDNVRAPVADASPLDSRGRRARRDARLVRVRTRTAARA